MEKLTRAKAEKFLKDGRSIQVKVKSSGKTYDVRVELLKGEVFNMDLFLFKLLRLNPAIDILPSLEFQVSVETVRVVYSNGWVIKNDTYGAVVGGRIRGPKQLVRYLNSHLYKVVNKGYLLPDMRKNLMF